MPSSDRRLERNPLIPSTEIDGEIVLMNSAKGSYYVLKDSAASIWEALGRGASPGGICGQLLREYSVDEETCRRDVAEFLESLLEHELIRAAGA